MNLTEEEFRRFIEQEIFEGKPYGFARLGLDRGNSGQTPRRRYALAKLYPKGQRYPLGQAQGNADQERERGTGNRQQGMGNSSLSLLTPYSLLLTQTKEQEASEQKTNLHFLLVERERGTGNREKEFNLHSLLLTPYFLLTEVVIDNSEIQREAAIGERERYFP